MVVKILLEKPAMGLPQYHDAKRQPFSSTVPHKIKILKIKKNTVLTTVKESSSF
jgi:hypothetical protein